MPSPSTQVRDAIIGILSTEFAAESLVVLSDKLHASMGDDGNYAGVYPVDETEDADQALTLVTTVRVQVYGYWDKQIDNKQLVDPTAIEDWADRFRNALRAGVQINTPEAWFMRLVRIEYPQDPTGNMTRFEATVQAWGQNTGLRETA